MKVSSLLKKTKNNNTNKTLRAISKLASNETDVAENTVAERSLRRTSQATARLPLVHSHNHAGQPTERTLPLGIRKGVRELATGRN